MNWVDRISLLNPEMVLTVTLAKLVDASWLQRPFMRVIAAL